jgi:radical SAM-linked protein
LRWISHRDLARTLERMLRRAGLGLRMSEGFHPKPKLMFPSALALGIEGQAEVMELELVRPADPCDVETRLNAQAPPGLVVSRVQVLDRGQGKARVRAMTYQFPVSQQRRQQVEQAIEQLLASSSLWVRRHDRPEPVNMRADLESLEWCDGMVRFRIRASHQASLRPRDVLQSLGLAELEQQGDFLTRSEVELTS